MEIQENLIVVGQEVYHASDIAKIRIGTIPGRVVSTPGIAIEWIPDKERSFMDLVEVDINFDEIRAFAKRNKINVEEVTTL